MTEDHFTPWANPYWLSWNERSPELSFCVAASLICMYQSGLVLETGVGEGYLARRTSRKADVLYLYEEDDELRNSIPTNSKVWTVKGKTPTIEQIGACRLLIVDSNFETRVAEIEKWQKYAGPESMILIHDTGNGHNVVNPRSMHARLWNKIVELEIDGIRYYNPRGSFLGWKSKPKEIDFLEFLLPTSPNPPHGSINIDAIEEYYEKRLD